MRQGAWLSRMSIAAGINFQLHRSAASEMLLAGATLFLMARRSRRWLDADCRLMRACGATFVCGDLAHVCRGYLRALSA